MMQTIDPKQPIVFVSHAAPMVMCVNVPNPNYGMNIGVPAGGFHREYYVCLSMLPAELRSRVETAIQAIVSGQ